MQAQTSHVRSAEPDRLFLEAQERLQSHRTEDAMEFLQKAIDIDPQHAPSLSLYGLCLAFRGLEYGRALSFCRRAIRCNPSNVEHQVHLARVYRLMGDHRSAYGVLLTAWKRCPRDATAASELTRMGVRRTPPLSFLPRSHVCNRLLGRLRERLRRSGIKLQLPHPA